MAMILLTTIFFAGGVLAILYSLLALLSLLHHARVQKALPDKYEPVAGKPAPDGPPVAEAFWGRAKILLQNQRFDAAVADCKHAIEINPYHAEAGNLWKHLVPADTVPIVPVPEITLPAAPVEPVRKVKAEEGADEPGREESKLTFELQAEAEVEPAAPAEAVRDIEIEEVTVEAEPEEIKPEVELQAEAEVEPAAPAETVPEIEAEEVAVEAEPEDIKPEVELQAEAEVEPAAPAEAVPEIEAEEVTVEAEPEEIKPEVELQAETEVEPAAAAETVPEIQAEEAAAETEPEETKASVELQVEAEVEPAAPVESGPPQEAEEQVILAQKPLPDKEEEAPLIPEDKLVVSKPQRESLLEEINHEKLKEFEDGAAGKEDAEWTRYADKRGPKLADSKIDMNELPAEATGLKETLSDLRRAETYNLQGENNLSKNFYNNAIKDFSRALEINPNYVDALINRGSAYAELGRFNDALMDFNHALKFEKRDAELFNKRGEIYLQNKMYNEAIRDFASALILNPLFSDAYLNRGRAYSEKGMPEEAMTDFKQAVKADSEHSFSFVDRAAPEVLIAESRSSNLEEAAKFIQMGLTEMQNEKFRKAVENFTQAINLASSEAEGYINRGEAFLNLDKIDEAMADFNKAVLFDPLNASLYYWRAQAWRAKNDQYNMREDLKLSCEMGHEPACFEYRELRGRKLPSNN